MSDFKNSNWVPSEEDNLGAISESYNLITKELENLQDKVNCPDNFIYDFLGAIQKEWNPESCKIKAKSFKNKTIQNIFYFKNFSLRKQKKESIQIILSFKFIIEFSLNNAPKSLILVIKLFTNF